MIFVIAAVVASSAISNGQFFLVFSFLILHYLQVFYRRLHLAFLADSLTSFAVLALSEHFCDNLIGPSDQWKTLQSIALDVRERE